MDFFNKKEYSSRDRNNIGFNSLSVDLKHLKIPIILGFIFGGIATYIILVSYTNENLNYLYIDGYFQALYARYISGAESIAYMGETFIVIDAITQWGDKLLINTLWILFLFVSTSYGSFDLIRYFKNKFLSKASAEYLDDKYIKGTMIYTEEDFSKRQEIKKVKGAPVGNISKFDDELECVHTMIYGSTGAGKTNIINQLYKWQKLNRPNGRWIYNDVKRSECRKFYNPDTDLIFDFSDARSLNFNVFSLIKTQPDIKAMISSIIPRNAQEKDPVWTNTSHDILEGIFYYCLKHNKKTNLDVKELIKLSPSDLAKKLKDVKNAEVAYGHLISGSQADNFMSNFRSNASFFTSLPDGLIGNDLDIEAWLENKENTQSTIFILNDTKNQELNSIRISVFIDSIVKTLLSMTQSKTRRIYFFIDEMGSLKKMDSIVQASSLGRSYGISLVMGAQDQLKLENIWGKELIASIVGSTTSKFILRAGDATTAEVCSKIIGDVKYKVTSLNSSSGADAGSIKEGSSYSSNEKIENAIMPSEIMAMEPNTYYYKNGHHGWTFIKKVFTQEENEEYQRFDVREEYIAPGFVSRADLDISNLFNDEEDDSDDESNSVASGGGQEVEQNLEVKIPSKTTDKKEILSDKEVVNSMEELNGFQGL